MKRFLILLFILVTVCSFAAMRGGAQYDPDAARKNLSNVINAMTLTLSGRLTAGEASFGTTGTQFNSAGALVMPNNTAIGMKQAGGDIKTFGYMNSSDQMQFGQSGQIAYFPGSSIVASGVINTATGTAAAPAYSFGSDPDTGIYSPGADSIGFSTQAGTGTATLESSDSSTIASIYHPKKSELYITGKDTNTSIGSLTAALYLANNNKNWPASLKAYAGGNGDGIDLAFSTTAAWTAVDIERMRLTAYGNLLIATSTDDGANKLQVNGFTKLGEAATGVKMKVLTGTTGTAGTAVTVAHGLTSSKIVSFNTIVYADANTAFPPGMAVLGGGIYQFETYSGTSDFSVYVAGGGSSVAEKPFVITVWYKE